MVRLPTQAEARLVSQPPTAGSVPLPVMVLTYLAWRKKESLTQLNGQNFPAIKRGIRCPRPAAVTTGRDLPQRTGHGAS
jgi:hypothetical protein